VKKLVITALAVIVACALLSGVAFAKSHKVEFRMKAVINGVELEPGTYKLEVNGDNKVDIYKGKELVVSAEVEILPLGNVYPNSVSQSSDGKVKEIRLKKERVVFAES
jgi:hypothetical protein